MKNIREMTIRGGFAKACGQAVNFVIRIFSMMILGRLLDPTDFGLVGMVAVATGIFNLLKDAGLSSATIQKATVTEEQVSTIGFHPESEAGNNCKAL